MELKSTTLLRHLVTETVLGYIFWSIFCGLFPMIWFYPLNELDFTGYEVFLAILLIPIICEIGPIMRWIQTRIGLSCLRLVALACILSFQVPSTYYRLVTLTIGTSAVLLILVVTLWNDNQTQKCLTFCGLVISYFTMLVSRIWYTSVFPTWADVTSNNIILTVGAIATIDKIFLSPDELLNEKTEKEKDKKKIDPIPEPAVKFNWLASGAAFGSLLYLIISIFGEVSLISRWVVRGYPDCGPSPYPWGVAVLMSIFIGIILSIQKPEFLVGKRAWICACVGLYFLYMMPGYIGFVGGLMVGIYSMSVWPEVVHRMTSCPPGRTMTIAMVIFMIEILFSIWTTAYNFVPGGEWTREHTGYKLMFIAGTLFLGLCLTDSKGEPKRFVSNQSGKEVINDSMFFTILFLLLTLGVSGFVYRFQHLPYEHNSVAKEKQKEVSALIWTFHFGYDNEGWPSLERAAKLLNDTGADVITLLESDASKPYLGNNDLAMWIGEKLKMYADFGPSTRDHTWGNLILSKHPIVSSQHHLLPSPHGELAPAISATINVSGSLIDFVTSHMGNNRDVLDRQLQAEYLSNLTANSKNAVVFLGYVTSSPGSRDYRQLTGRGRVKDIDDTDRDRWCEYIMYRGLIRLGYARISHGGLSDTEIQLAKFRIPDDPDNFRDHDRIEINAAKVPPGQRFDARFGDFRHGHNWARTHQFHASTPKYFLED